MITQCPFIGDQALRNTGQFVIPSPSHRGNTALNCTAKIRPQHWQHAVQIEVALSLISSALIAMRGIARRFRAVAAKHRVISRFESILVSNRQAARRPVQVLRPPKKKKGDLPELAKLPSTAQHALYLRPLKSDWQLDLRCR